MMGNLLSKVKDTKMESMLSTRNEDETAESSKCFDFCRRNKGHETVSDESVMKHFGYDLFETIGKGAYAKVKRGYSEKYKTEVAIKIVDRQKAPSEIRRKFLPREVKIAYFAKQENIVRCFQILKARDKVYMVLELVENGDLLKYVVSQNFVVESKAKKIAKGVISAVKYLHQRGIAHRDLKLENILLDRYLNPKLSDFGFARVVEKQKLSCTFCGSAAYAPMEILSGTPYDPFRVDLWSLGVIIYAMTIGYMPFSDSKQLTKMKKGVSFRSFKQKPSKELQDIISKILVNEPRDRLSPDEILNHDWLTDRHVIVTRQWRRSSETCDSFGVSLNIDANNL